MEKQKIIKNSSLNANSWLNIIKKYLNRLIALPYGYLALAFIIPVVIMYVIYIAMEIHPFGNGSVLVLDLNGQYVYFYEALRNFVYGDASLLYSFCRALGGEFMGIYAYYIASPFSYIVCLFPQTKILDALLCIFLLKTGLCGFTFGFYIHKTEKILKNIQIYHSVIMLIQLAQWIVCKSKFGGINNAKRLFKYSVTCTFALC
jgi:uncharacterized membrane protein YfhO